MNYATSRSPSGRAPRPQSVPNLYPATVHQNRSVSRLNEKQVAFIFFINSVLAYLKTLSSGPLLAAQVKVIIIDCIKRNRAGNTSVPLRQAILVSIKECIGRRLWVLALMYYKRACENSVLLSSFAAEHGNIVQI